jgi:ATP-dependent DNA ligase
LPHEAPALIPSVLRGVRQYASRRTSVEVAMAECVWLKPVLVGQFEFLEWTADNHLRHSKFVGLREDKKARDVARE